MTPVQQNILGSSLAALSVLAFAMEWWFIREIEVFYLTGFLLISLLFSVAILILSFAIFSQKIRDQFPATGKKWLLAFGMVDIFAFSFFFLAVINISVIKTLLWVGLSTFYVLFLSPLLLGEKLTTRKIIAAIFGFGGMATYLILGNESPDFLSFSIGDLYAFLCGVFMIGFYLIGKKTKNQPLYWKLWFTWIPGVIALPFVWHFFGNQFSITSFSSFSFSALFFTLLATSLFMAMICYQLAVRYIEASKIATIRMIEPVFQGVTAFLIANETLNIWQGIGAMFVLWGIFLVRK